MYVHSVVGRPYGKEAKIMMHKNLKNNPHPTRGLYFSWKISEYICTSNSPKEIIIIIINIMIFFELT